MRDDIAKLARAMIAYDSPDAARVNHALKVHGFASLIARSEGLSDSARFVVEACALLHDIGIHEAERKHGSNAGKFQEMEGPPIAERLIAESGVRIEGEILERIKRIIGNHHSYRNIDGADFQILVEADFLVNIFEAGMEGPEVEKLRENIFKTGTGTSILTALYPGSGG